MLKPEMKLVEQLGSSSMALPKRRVEIDLTPVSRVLNEPMVCHPNSPVEFQLLTSARRNARPGGGLGAAAAGADVVRQVQPNIKSELHEAAEVGLCSIARVCAGCVCLETVLWQLQRADVTSLSLTLPVSHGPSRADAGLPGLALLTDSSEVNAAQPAHCCITVEVW